MTASFVSITQTPNYFICYDVELLLLQLQNNVPVVRQHARETLGKIGKEVVPSLIQLLTHHNEHVRWEACKTLERIRDPKTGISLAETLLDDDADVRWVASEALIALEHHAVEPLMNILKKHFNSILLREAAHHVLRELKRKNIFNEKLEEVYTTLNSLSMPMRLAVKANDALNYYRENNVVYMSG